jgi:hypothetical protein
MCGDQTWASYDTHGWSPHIACIPRMLAERVTLTSATQQLFSHQKRWSNEQSTFEYMVLVRAAQ